EYERLSLPGLLANKGMNLLALAADPVLWRTQLAEPAWRSGFLGYARIALLVRSSRRAMARVVPLAAFTGLALACWAVLLWGGDQVTTINHQGAYAVIVLFIGLCALAVTYLPWPAATVILAGCAAWFAVSWIPGLGFVPAAAINVPAGAAPAVVRQAELASQLNPAMLIVCLA